MEKLHENPRIEENEKQLSKVPKVTYNEFENVLEQILCYLKGTMNMALFYTNDSKSDLIGYANLGYLSYPHNG